MEPIINPWLIYAVNMCGNLKTLAMIGAILIVLPITILSIEYSINSEANQNEKRNRLYKLCK